MPQELQPALLAAIPGPSPAPSDALKEPFKEDTAPIQKLHKDEEDKVRSDIKKDVTILPKNTKGLHTVFIHKLYNMLEDEELKRLIWWSASNESFLITPGEDFSKALAQYFKHTNVASFIRQLNMYGFHKVSDGGNPGTSGNDPVWEFKHSSGSFRKGDVDGLKTIKRRSSKHAQRNPTSTNNQLAFDSGTSDTEASERSNSFADLQSLNTPDSGNNPSIMDPILNMRLAEIGHNLAALRHEHARLQLRYDNATEDLRKTNLDMVFLIDLIQKLIYSSKPNTKDVSNLVGSPSSIKKHAKADEETASPGSNPTSGRLSNEQYSLADVESDIARFRASIIQRAGSKDFDQFPVSFAPSYQINQPVQTSSVTSQPNIQVHPQNTKQPPPPPQFTPSFAGTQSPSDSSGPVPYPYPYPPSRHSSAHQVHLIQQVSKKQQLPHHPPPLHPQSQIVHDPFVNDRKSSNASSRQRHMSILYDPLQPAPQSPANTIHRNSLSGKSTMDSNLTSPVVSQTSYFPDYGVYNQQNPQYPTPPPAKYQGSPQYPQPITPTDQTRSGKDQRSGSYPSLVPNVQYSLRGATEGLIRKRSKSSDVPERSLYDNLPRSVPRPEHEEPLQQNIHRSASAAGLYNNLRRGSVSPSSAIMDPQRAQPLPSNENNDVSNPNGQSTNSGVYALLNPERDGNPNKKQKNDQ